MNATSIKATDIALRRFGVLLGAAALGVALLSGCGSDASAEDDTTGTSSEQEQSDSQKAAAEGLPEGFPDDVPLPDFTTATKIGGESGPDIASEWWSVVFTLKDSTKTPVEDYAAKLSGAGYTVTKGSNATEAEGPKWDISFHSSMKDTLTVGIISK